MTWYTERFLHLPAKISSCPLAPKTRWVREHSLSLNMEDGWKICLEMSDCMTPMDINDGNDICRCGCKTYIEKNKIYRGIDKYFFRPNSGCGYDEWSQRVLTIDELIQLRDACNKVIRAYNKGEITKEGRLS